MEIDSDTGSDYTENVPAKKVPFIPILEVERINLACTAGSMFSLSENSCLYIWPDIGFDGG